jgi:GNAT superfamily N-acetyltransferase
MSPASQSIEYSIYTASDAKEMIRLLSQVFAERDPPALALGLTEADFEVLVRLISSKAAAEGLTIVARSSKTGEMCGALLAEDSASPVPDGIELVSSKFAPIFDILTELVAEYRGDEVPRPGESIHLFLLGVARDFAGKGVAKQLVERCIANGARKGYRLAVSEATNKTSQNVFRQQGFIERARRSYGDHRFKGQAVFASIADQGGPVLMEKRLSSAD